jgi:beta-glucanase (GH16 family)
MAHGPGGPIAVLVAAVENRAVTGSTGTVAVTLANFTGAASGEETITGTSARTLANFTGAASGTVANPVTGTVAVTLENFTAAGLGSGIITGTSAVTLANFTSAATGAETITGTVARTLANFTSTASGTGANPVTGTVARTLANFTSSASATEYVLIDEFSGSSIDSTLWDVYNRIGDEVNGEVNAVIPANVRVSSGTLKIDSKFEDVVTQDTDTAPTTVHYTSGQIAQKRLPFKYGDVRVRAQIPGGTGLWPCIWMLGYKWQASQPYNANVTGADWPNDGWCEVDIAEFMFNHRNDVNTSLHWNTPGSTEERALPFDATTRFMVYRLLWTPTSLTWYVDAEDGNGFVTLRTVTGTAGVDIPNVATYLIIHTAIGGTGGGTPVSGTFPQTMEVDYARILATSDTVIPPMAAVVLQNFTSSASGTSGISISGTSATTLANFTGAASGTETITGTVAATLANLTSSASGTETITGTSAVTLANFTGAASGTETITGTVAATLQNFTGSASGLADIVGTSAVTLANFTSAATGSETITGSSATTLQNFSSTASGLADITGTVAVTLANFTGAASGSITNPGSNGASVLQDFTGAASGSVVFTGTSATTLQNFTSAASGTEAISGSAAVTLAPFTSSTTGTETITGSVAVALANFAASAVGSESFIGTVARTLANFICAATGTSLSAGGSAAVTLQNFVAAGVGVVTNPPGGLGDRLPFDDNVVVMIGGSFNTSAIIGQIRLGTTVTGDDDTVLIVDRQAQRHTTFDEWTVLLP